jgi:hypothetical protein
MNNNALMREKLERLKIRQTNLEIEAKALARDIPPLINPVLQDVIEMQVAVAAAKMDDLVMRQGELLKIRGQIWDLEEALGQ